MMHEYVVAACRVYVICTTRSYALHHCIPKWSMTYIPYLMLILMHIYLILTRISLPSSAAHELMCFLCCLSMQCRPVQLAGLGPAIEP